MGRRKKEVSLPKKKKKLFLLTKNKYTVFIFSSSYKNKENKIKELTANIKIDNKSRYFNCKIGDVDKEVKNVKLIKGQYGYFILDAEDLEYEKVYEVEAVVVTRGSTIFEIPFFVKRIRKEDNDGKNSCDKK